MQAVLPLLLLLLLLAVFQPVDLHGLARLGLPCISQAVRQRHGCRDNHLPSQGYTVPSSVHPFPERSQHLWEVCGLRRWGFSLQWADRGMEAWEGEGPAQGDRGGLRALSLAYPPPHVLPS